jgi:phospholipase/lecithinase/hemolysin
MKTLKCLMVALLALLPLATGVAVADTEHGYSRIFIFGASFIDPGNRYADTGVSSSPPFLDPLGPVAYDVGGHRATNGRTWVEVMAQEMGLTKWAKPAYRDPVFGNYAYDHARVRDVELPYTALGPSLRQQVERWTANGYCANAPMNDTLFVVDSGGADLLDVMLLPDGADPSPIIFGVMAAITNQIAELYDCGARNFLVADLFPLGYAPGVALVGNPEEANQLAAVFNGFLGQVISGITNAYPDTNIETTGFYDFSKTVIDFSDEFGFTNVTEPCVTFFVVENAYCDKPKEYFFWDYLHPTKAAHALLGRHALGQLPVPD